MALFDDDFFRLARRVGDAMGHSGHAVSRAILGSQPPLDVVRDEVNGDLSVSVDLPGVDRAQVSVDLDPDARTLTIAGMRPCSKDFRRVFGLPADGSGDSDAASAGLMVLPSHAGDRQTSDPPVPSFARFERPCGPFSRTIELPSGGARFTPGDVSAALGDDGVLRVKVASPAPPPARAAFRVDVA
jgi:HSP20 family molecular chaperone IbpA